MFTSTPKPVKNSNEVCKRTIEKRNKFLKNQLLFSSGGNESGFSVQTGKLVKSLKENERVEILKRANITTKSITPEEFVAMKADLSIPWSKLKTMSRWLSTFNISIPSQRKQRKVATEWTGDQLRSEQAPFSFEVKGHKGKFEIRSAAWVYVESLESQVKTMFHCLRQ